MQPFRIYIDTSVFGGCFDEGFAEDSIRVMEAVRSGRIRAVLTDLVIAELQNAPSQVRSMIESLPIAQVERTIVNDEILSLRDAYIRAGVIGHRWLDDATHVAAAAVARVDAIVSWNFKHIVRLDRIKAYNRVNVNEGYGILTILSPREVRDDTEIDDTESV